MKIQRRRLIWAAVILALAALVVIAFLPDPVPVETVRVSTGDLRVVLEADGMTRVHDRYTVSAPVSGELARPALREGDPVRRGEMLATILPASVDPVQREEIEQRIAAAEAVLSQARTAAERVSVAVADAERDRGRTRALLETGAVAQQEVDRAESALRMATRDLESSRYRVQEATYQLDLAKAARGAYDGARAQRKVLLTSPVAGRVLKLIESSDRVVAVGTPIMQVGDPASEEVVIDLLSSDAVGVEPGMRVVIDGWGGDRPLEARVRYVEPSAFTKISALGVEEQRVNVVADLIDHPFRLGDGFRVRAGVVLWEGKGRVKIPTSALFHNREEWCVFVIRNGHAVRLPVRIGHRSALEAEVLAGLRPGDEVVVHPSDQVADGVSVTPAVESE
jgi:HlyD family secretion protein